MAYVCHLIDISSNIYTGAFNQHSYLKSSEPEIIDGQKTENIQQTGGILSVFKYIEKALTSEPEVEHCFFCCADRKPTKRLKSYEAYKSGRSKDFDVEVQKRLAERILKECNIPVFYQEGVEADDLIYSIRKQYDTAFDAFFINADDRDLMINVDERCIMLPVRKQGQVITKENYSAILSKKHNVPYNAVSYYKSVVGDSSDSIPACSRKDWGLELMFMKDVDYANKELIKHDFRYLGNDFLRNVELVYPILVDIEMPGDLEIDMEKFHSFGKSMKGEEFKIYNELSTDYVDAFLGYEVNMIKEAVEKYVKRR